MRFGVIGVGRMGIVHAQTLSQLPQVDAVIVSDADRAKKAADDLGLELAPSTEALFESADAVVIAAATSAHAKVDPCRGGCRRPGLLREAHLARPEVH